jgi:septal ring factor EnvC (AmiA/AmiB activator)
MTNRLNRGFGAAAATALLTAGLATGVASVASADDPATPSVPCARQQAQVDRAAAKLEKLQAVFNHEKRDLKKAERAVAAADTAREKKHAKVDVVRAKADVAEAAKVKKAQVQRLAKAQQRLSDCQAAATTTTDPTPSPTV